MTRLPVPLLCLFCVALVSACVLPPAPLERITVSTDSTGFTASRSGTPFRPWGFNYDHDSAGKLLEEYWEEDWPRVEGDFREMKALGANVVRIHLQVGRFLESPTRPHAPALARLRRLVDLAERTGLYLDLTGLGCYRKRDVPPWYDALDEAGRWAAQAVFWRAVAGACGGSPAVFCYDLMNEPVVPGGRRRDGDWLGPPFGEGEDALHFVQFVTLDQAGRPRPEIARSWTRHLVRAIREVDSETLITIGLVPWSLDRPGLTSGFVPAVVAPELDFLAVHLYPERDGADDALETLRGFAIGKPLLVEETFPLRSGIPELEEVMDRSRDLVAGWLSFYWGATPDELAARGTMRDAILREWLLFFSETGPQ